MTTQLAEPPELRLDVQVTPEDDLGQGVAVRSQQCPVANALRRAVAAQVPDPARWRVSVGPYTAYLYHEMGDVTDVYHTFFAPLSAAQEAVQDFDRGRTTQARSFRLAFQGRRHVFS